MDVGCQILVYCIQEGVVKRLATIGQFTAGRMKDQEDCRKGLAYVM